MRSGYLQEEGNESFSLVFCGEVVKQILTPPFRSDCTSVLRFFSLAAIFFRSSFFRILAGILQKKYIYIYDEIPINRTKTIASMYFVRIISSSSFNRDRSLSLLRDHAAVLIVGIVHALVVLPSIVASTIRPTHYSTVCPRWTVVSKWPPPTVVLSYLANRCFYIYFIFFWKKKGGFQHYKTGCTKRKKKKTSMTSFFLSVSL